MLWKILRKRSLVILVLGFVFSWFVDSFSLFCWRRVSSAISGDVTSVVECSLVGFIDIGLIRLCWKLFTWFSRMRYIICLIAIFILYYLDVILLFERCFMMYTLYLT